jgi:hypothetical protein
LAQAAAGTGGKNDCGNRHPHQCTGNSFEQSER